MHIQQAALRRTLSTTTVIAAAMLCASVVWAKSPAASQSGASQLGIEMVDIPAGNFLMGSCRLSSGGCAEMNYVDFANDETPQHRVTIKAFQMGKTPITVGQFEKFVAVSGFKPSNKPKTRESISDNDLLNEPYSPSNNDEVQALIDWLNKTDGGGWRLPSEAEWEYACNAGSRRRYCGSNDLHEVAWFKKDSEDSEYREVKINRKQPVASKQPNAFGLYDMSGNVWELVADCWVENYQGAPNDGSARTSGCKDDNPNGGFYRVYRGGSWLHASWDARATRRIPESKHDLALFLLDAKGFRLARTHAAPHALSKPALAAKIPPTPAKPKPVTTVTAKTDACTGLHNGKFVRVLVKGAPLPSAAMVLEAGKGQMTVRIAEGPLAGAKQIRPCTDARP